MLQILDTGTAAAQENMDRDQALLDQLDPNGKPILHLYDWIGPSATFGYFADPGEHLDLEKARARGLALGRRPTGGGIVFHIWDYAFSFLMPSGHPAFSINTLDNYRFVNEAVQQAIADLYPIPDAEIIADNFPSQSEECQNFCMAKPTKYDVVWKGRKIAGAAQRKRKQGYLHQGTISLALPHLDLLGGLLKSRTVLEAMAGYTFAPLGSCWSPALLKEARVEVRRKLIEKLMEKLESTRLY